MHSDVAKVLVAYGRKNLVLMRELVAVINPEDDESIMWLALGLPMIGWAPVARGLMNRTSPPAATVDDWLTGRETRNTTARNMWGLAPSQRNRSQTD